MLRHEWLACCDPAALAGQDCDTLTFDEEVTPAFSGFDVEMGGSMKMPIKTTVSKDRKSIMGVPSGALMPGAYKIPWHAAAGDDGHKSTGTLAFTVK